MKKYLSGLFFVALVTIAVVPSSVRAETTSSSVSGMLELLQSLMKQVEALQKQLAALKGDISDEIRDGLKEGMTNDDIRKIQELLATDPDIYPKGLASGYYGPLTKDAVKKFQKRHGLEETGIIDNETKKLMQEYFKERQNGKFPPGLLRAPGIDKKIKDRMRERDGKWELDCDDKKASGPLCKHRDDDDDDDENDDDDDNYNKVSTSTAKNAIDDAKDAINDLEDAIDDASDEEAIEDAEDALDDAKDELEEAEEEFEDRDFDSAYEKAKKAEKIAQKGEAKLQDSDDNDVASSTAKKAIDDAKDAIDDLEDTIDDSDYVYAKNIAKNALEEAEDELEEAQTQS